LQLGREGERLRVGHGRDSILRHASLDPESLELPDDVGPA
jgi:hypothetical protein